MKKKIVSCVLIASFLSYIGCHTTETLTGEKIGAMDGQADITVVMKNRNQFVFEAGKYNLSADSLSGIGFRKTVQFPEIPFQGSLPRADIALIEAKEFSTGKTILFAGAFGLAIAGVIAAANSSDPPPPPPPPPGGRSSCPFIYTFDGSEYHFESETFAGAVFKGVERTAYDMLYHLKPVNGVCRFKLVNAREETEYVNELKLFAIDHPLGTTVIPDRSGAIHTISNPIQAMSCVEFGGRNALGEIREKDRSYWQSNLTGRDWTDERNLRDGLVAEFPKPTNAKSVKLVVNGRNTRLGYFALAKIFQLKGSNKLDWYRQLESDPVERATFARWLMREGMLHIQVWQNGKWTEKTALPDVGPGISKDQVALLDISEITDDVLRIRLACTTDLWCIDQIYADYSPDVPIQTRELSLRSAINEQGQAIADLLKASDDRYYTTINDQYADIEFIDAPRQHGSQRSYVAKTKGFYYQWLDSEGPAQDDLVERILKEPIFGVKLLMPQWLKERVQYEGIAEEE